MTTRNTAQVQGIKLAPVACADEAAVFEAAFDGFRRRPVVAKNHDGALVVCCSRTARKHGWTVEGRLFDRTPVRVEKPAPKKTRHLDNVIGLLSGKLSKAQRKAQADKEATAALTSALEVTWGKGNVKVGL